MARLQFVAPVLPSTDMDRTVAHYERLGFRFGLYRDAAYTIAQRDDVELHFGVMSDYDPLRMAGCVWIFVDDADALYAEWQALGVDVREPCDTEYQIREGAHIDPDNNLLRFASALPGCRASRERSVSRRGPDVDRLERVD